MPEEQLPRLGDRVHANHPALKNINLNYQVPASAKNNKRQEVSRIYNRRRN